MAGEQERGGGDSHDNGKPAEPEKPEQAENKNGEEQQKDAAENDKPPLYKRPVFWIVAGIAALALIVGGVLYWLHARQYVSSDDAFVDAHIVRISPQVAGILQSVPAQDNRHVQPGQLLATIDPAAPAAQRQQALAELGQAEAAVHQAEGQVIAAIAQRDKSAADAVAPAAEAARGARDYARYATLQRLDPAAAASTQVDQALTNARSTAAQAVAARRDIATARANIRVARKQVEAARAQAQAAQARVAETNVTIGNLRLTAPVPGQVVNRMVNVGSYVAPGQQLMAIVPDRIWVTANFKETQLKNMRLGQHVDIRVDAFPNIAFEGHVDSIQRGAGQAFQILPPQNATGNYVKVVQRVPVRILFDRPDPRRWPIGPGMSVVPRVKVR